MSQIRLSSQIIQQWRQRKLVLLLLVCCVLSALAVVQMAHLNRQLTIQQDLNYQQRDQLDTEWRNLLLEQRALAEHSRVEEIARRQLNMQRPSGDRDIRVQQP
ncbi:MAG: cell division protein FtsL [Alishewanella agri]|jgi:cell division protein FtsL|uniref:Cell division protein FtsL n=1 Tax=Alishewanella agri BL06 TaxID=1195246 RepID=I9P216_9ALTE|nr:MULTISPECIES: cell division protein FtsL [Alishewanella]MDD4865413.1 cell division protein FtsL [Alishewanella agri]OYW96346.1 MAG: cell division protein FtsL [Alishewanella sp. 32-51-5]OZB39688.1 MAG: cell division protein FtsL [Alishewanella sp. 34-51-39]EIW88977.1 cell division protein FtsL [Alishewanella agri BL06]KRS21332.1 cell division protein FtsL [Alishewanella sp. WH16-1]